MSNKRVDLLTTAECRELLDRHHFGRLGLMNYVGVFPSIIPVNYLLDKDKIVIRTDAGSKLNAALRGAPVAFEVDGYDKESNEAWSVVIKGRGEEIKQLHERIESMDLPLFPWNAGPKSYFVRIVPETISGRRFRVLDSTAWETPTTHARRQSPE